MSHCKTLCSALATSGGQRPWSRAALGVAANSRHLLYLVGQQWGTDSPLCRGSDICVSASAVSGLPSPPLASARASPAPQQSKSQGRLPRIAEFRAAHILIAALSGDTSRPPFSKQNSLDAALFREICSPPHRCSESGHSKKTVQPFAPVVTDNADTGYMSAGGARQLSLTRSQRFQLDRA